MSVSVSYDASSPLRRKEGLFHTDSVALSYSDVDAAKEWWIDTFGCKTVKVPPDWDNPLPSYVALALPGDSEPTILLSTQSEVSITLNALPRGFCVKRPDCDS
jgi:hypothetical protein